MTSFGDSPASVEQGLFANHEGVRLIACSVQDRGVQGKWQRTLERFTRLEVFAGSTPPPPFALSYWVLGGNEVAVLYRWLEEGGSPGRNPSRVLVGAPNVLTVPVAVGLYGWPWWTQYEPDQQLRPLDAEKLVRAGESGAAQLRELAGKNGALLEKVTAQLIQNRNRKIGVVGCSPEQAAVVACALPEIAEQYLIRRFGERRDWSFSTYEVDYAVGLPDIVFFPGRPDGQDPDRRVLIAPQSENPTSRDSLNTATYLVHRFLTDDRSELVVPSAPQPASLTEDRAHYPPYTPEPAPSRSGRAPEWALQEAVRSSNSADSFAPSATASEVRASPQRIGAATGPVPGEPGRMVSKQPSTGGSRNGGGGAATGSVSGAGTGDDPLRRLVGSQDADGVQWALDEMSSTWKEPDRRRALRKRVAPKRIDEAVAAINHLTAGPTHDAHYERILQIFFGPELEDMRPAVEYVGLLILGSYEPRFIQHLMEQIVDRYPELWSGLAPAAAHRYAMSHGLPSFGGPDRTMKRQRARFAGPRWLWPVVAGAAAVILFVLGYFLGTSTVPTPTSDVANGTETGAASSTPNAPESPLPGAGGGASGGSQPKLPLITVPIAGTPATNKLVVMVVDGDGNLRFGAECRSDQQNWNCPPAPYPSGTAQSPGTRPIVVVSAADNQLDALLAGLLTQDQLQAQGIQTVMTVNG